MGTVTARSSLEAYTVTLTDGHHQWKTDIAVANGGGDQAADPESQLLGALGACTTMTLRMYAARKQWPVESISVTLSDIRPDADHMQIKRTIEVIGKLDDTQRQRLLEIAEKCPVHRILSGDIEINSTLS